MSALSAVVWKDPLAEHTHKHREDFVAGALNSSLTQPQAGQHQISYRLAFISAHTTDRDSRDCLYATRRQTPTGCTRHGRDRMRQRNQHSDELRDGSPPPKQDSVQTPNANSLVPSRRDLARTGDQCAKNPSAHSPPFEPVVSAK